MPAVDFRTFSRSVVANFLQTVVVLDDGAFMEPDESGEPLVEPDPDAPILDETTEDPGTPILVRTDNSLDARLLIDGFASQGLICAVLLPWTGNDIAAPTLNASRRADIVILDWQLGDDGEKATLIMQRLLLSDEQAGGRLRMIVIYTASPNLEEVRDSVASALPDFAYEGGSNGLGIALASKKCRIVFLRKGRATGAGDAVREDALANRLMDEFVELARGLLANVALGAIAAIRDETHRVLARLHGGLDGPFLTHRLLLVTPDDAEDYVVDLLSSEFHALLQSRGLGQKHVQRDVIEGALIERERSGQEFRLMRARNDDRQTVTVTREDVMKLVDLGPAGLSSIQNVGIAENKLHERLYVLLEADHQSGLAKHYEFARASALVRESATCGIGWVPRLGLGTIVKNGEGYLICIQPLCDAVRLKGPTQFIFAPLTIDPAKFDVVVKSPEGVDTCLRLGAQASLIRTVTFAPDPRLGVIQASKKGDSRVFTGSEAQECVWIADLRTSFAQRMVHRIATNLSRIGLDEFEWQRRHS